MDLDSNFPQIQLLKNSNLMQPLQIGKSRFQIANSCGLDSIIHLLACHYADNIQFKNLVKSNATDNSNFWKLL